MAQAALDVQTVLRAAQKHLSERNVCTFATSHRDSPWAASAFYVIRGLNIFTCQRKDARTLAHMRANPNVAFAVDDNKVEAWFQGLGQAKIITGPDEGWAREQLQRAAPEFAKHFANPDYPVLSIGLREFTFVNRNGGITPRQHLIRQGDDWRFA
ncbi:MAG: pyridoxamine 5'-phosphate oxidase family protein [bacterium]